MSLKLLPSIVLATLPTLAAADTFVLVHGAFQDAAVWSPVAGALEAKGHAVVTVSLPGRDADGQAAQAVTLDAYIDTTLEAVRDVGEPVILVGHSFGGMTISGVADQFPALIDKLIYVAAYVPVSGESMEMLAVSDADNSFTEDTFVIAKDYSYAVILDAHQASVFAQDANEAQVETLKGSMIREPLGPIGTPLTLSGNLDLVDKAFVMTTADRTVSTTLQRRMVERAGITEIREIETGHAPYLTAPDALAALLDELAE